MVGQIDILVDGLEQIKLFALAEIIVSRLVRSDANPVEPVAWCR